MVEKIYVDWDESLAAVNFKREWRFFTDIEVMFLLDYSAYGDSHDPAPGELRYGTMLVDENNAEIWMQSLSRELYLEQLLYVYWKGSEERIKPTFVIDFDKKLWIGSNWKHDQSPLHEYQPEGWTAHVDDVMKYLPAKLKSYFE